MATTTRWTSWDNGEDSSYESPYGEQWERMLIDLEEEARQRASRGLGASAGERLPGRLASARPETARRR